MMSRRTALAGLAAAPLAAGLAPQAFGGVRAASLRMAAEQSGRFYGAAVRPGQLTRDWDFAAIVAQDCGWLTSEVDLKWDHLTPEPYQWNYAPADALVAFARERHLSLRGHALLWEQSTPAWARGVIKDTHDWSVVQRHFEGVLSRYGNLPQWDVVNEPIDTGESDALRKTVFRRAYGADYVRRALDTAHTIAPGTKLFINDYGFDYANPVDAARRDAMVRMVETLRGQGAPLHGVGIQAHLDLSKGPIAEQALSDFLGRLAATGVEIVITELDVLEARRKASADARDTAVAAHVRQYLGVVLGQPAVKGVLTWGLSDRDSWLNKAALNRGLPYDAELARKPMYWAMHAAFTAA